MDSMFKAEIKKSLVECDLIIEELENENTNKIFMFCVLLVLLLFICLAYIHKIKIQTKSMKRRNFINSIS